MEQRNNAGSSPDAMSISPAGARKTVDDLLLGKVLPLLFFCLFSLVHLGQLVRFLQGGQPVDLAGSSRVVNTGFNVICFLLMTGIYIRREIPVGRTGQLRERVIAFLGTFTIMLSPAVQGAESNHATVLLAALGFKLLGGTLTVYSLVHLSRNFSIIPEARNLVRSGPYRFVRHPMYSSEILWIFGFILPIFSIPLFVLYLVMVWFLVLRMGYEERLLERHLPGYADYRKSTWRLLPYVI